MRLCPAHAVTGPVPPPGDESAAVKDVRLLSRLLFESRERVEMARDMVESRTGQTDEWARRLVAEIDEYRAARGWSPHGFGGET
jgi:hypothetical protein